MAFDFASRTQTKMARKQPSSSSKRKTFDDSLKDCLTDAFDKQIENFQTKNLYNKNGGQNASNWMRQDINGEWFISYRIKGKPIFFTDEVGKEGGWIHSTDVVGDLNAIRTDIDNGMYADQIKEAFNRPSRKEMSKAKAE